MSTLRTRKEIEKEIKDFLGLLPSFFVCIPDEMLDFEWEMFKQFEFDEPIIPIGIQKYNICFS